MSYSPESPESCATCANTHCDLHAGTAFQAPTHPARLFMVDESWPEYVDYIAKRLLPSDRLLVPLDGVRWGKANYAWQVPSGTMQAHAVNTLLRSFVSRFYGAEGAERRSLIERQTRKLYRSYRKQLSYAVQELTLDQSFLTVAWQHGDLGGRRYDVLMKRYPYRILQERLDAAAKRYPESPTLADFRVNAHEVEDEWAALQGARRIVTPHADVARLFPQKTVLLQWKLPERPKATGTRIAFAGPTLGRKGCYEVRELARIHNLRLIVFGGIYESSDFWQGVDIGRRAMGPDAWQDIGILLAPEIAASRPKVMLEALARGIRVVATAGSGLLTGTYADFHQADWARVLP